MTGCLFSFMSLVAIIRYVVFPVLVLVFLVLGIRHFLRKK